MLSWRRGRRLATKTMDSCGWDGEWRACEGGSRGEEAKEPSKCWSCCYCGSGGSGAAFSWAKKEVKKKEEGKKGVKMITMTERFHCQAKDVYKISTDENRLKGFTQSNAKITKEVGGQFSLFDGSITGVDVELEEGKRIVQKWRFGSREDEIHTMVIIYYFFCLNNPFFNRWDLLLFPLITSLCNMHSSHSEDTI